VYFRFSVCFRAIRRPPSRTSSTSWTAIFADAPDTGRSSTPSRLSRRKSRKILNRNCRTSKTFSRSCRTLKIWQKEKIRFVVKQKRLAAQALVSKIISNNFYILRDFGWVLKLFLFLFSEKCLKKNCLVF